MILADIADQLSAELIGEKSLQIASIAPIHEAKQGDLTFVLENKFIPIALKSSASAFITFKEIDGLKNQIVASNPKQALANVINLFKESIESAYTKNHVPKISESATLSSTAHISDHCSIGTNSFIAPFVSIGFNCRIGNNVIIHPNVTIYNHTIIGDNVIIHAGAVIGADGFGYYNLKDEWIKVPHVGYVQIDDNVEIGANTCVDRGCIGVTRIMKGCKLDNLVQVAHNTTLKENVALASQVGITGSTVIGNNTMIGGQAGIDTENIGSYNIITGKAGVTRNTPDHAILSGFPAWEHKKELKKEAYIRKLIR